MNDIQLIYKGVVTTKVFGSGISIFTDSGYSAISPHIFSHTG